MNLKIKPINDTQNTITGLIKGRDNIEKHTYNEIIKSYQALIKKLYDSQGKNDALRSSILSNIGSKIDLTGNNSEKLHKLNEELREAYK